MQSAEDRATRDRQTRVVSIDMRTIGLVIGLVVVATLVWLLVTYALGTLLLLFVAITFGEGIRPVVKWLERRHVLRPVGVLVVYLALVTLVFGTLWLLLSPLTLQLVEFVAHLPSYLQRLQNLFASIQVRLGASPEAQQLLQSVPGDLASLGTSLGSLLLSGPLIVADLAFKVIELYLMAFFWLTATDPLKPFVVGAFPPSLHGQASDVIAELGYKLGGHVRAVAVNMVAISLLSGAGLLILGIPYPLLLAFVAGLAETLPLLGPWLSGAFAIGVTVFTGGALQAGEVAGLYLVIHLIEGNTLVPYVTYRITQLNPLATIAAISAGGSMLGIVGAVLGVPLALVLQVLILDVAMPVLRHLVGTPTREDIRNPTWP